MSYSLLFSPGGNAPTEHLYDEEVTTDARGHYRHPALLRSMIPGGHSVRDQIAIAASQRYFQETRSVTMGQWTSLILLVPHVRDLSECRGNATCLEMNEHMARECYLEPSHGQACQVYSTAGWSRFFDQSRDFLACNGLDDATAIRCIDIAVHEQNAIADEISCARVEGELPRNFCYLAAFWRTRRGEYCELITSKAIPAPWFGDNEPLVHNALFAILTEQRRERGLLDFRSICLDATGWWK